MKKTIIITGSAGYLGKIVTSSLLKEGYNIHATLGPNESSEHIDDLNYNSYNVNLLDAEVTKYFINNVTSIEDDNLVALICLKDDFAMGSILETNSTQINKSVALNFTTTYNITKPLIAYCKKNKRPLQLIFIGSRIAIEPHVSKNFIGYSLGKSLLFRLAEFINTDSNTTNITASIIVPSTLDTPCVRSSMPDSDSSFWVPASNVTNTILFILSDTGKMMRNPIYKLYNKS